MREINSFKSFELSLNDDNILIELESKAVLMNLEDGKEKQLTEDPECNGKFKQRAIETE